MTAIDEARSKYDIRTILGLENSKRKIVCPLPMHVHHNNTPSFSVFFRAGTQYFKCHGSCGVEGDVVDLIGYLRISGYNRKDKNCVTQALALLSDHWEPQVVIPEREVELDPDQHLLYLPPSAAVTEYARKRGLTPETMGKFSLGSWGNFMTMPNFEEGRLLGIKLRRIVKGEPRFFSMEGSRLGLFNFDAVNLTTRPVLIVKGEIPCMLLDQMGYLACAPTGGESSWNKHERWKVALALAPKIVVGDNDGPGRIQGAKRAELMGAWLVFPPEPHKDIDSWILADKEAAVTQIHQWIKESYASQE